MIIKEIDGEEFNYFANNHILKNFYQTKEYGELMKKSEYKPIFIGAYSNESLVAASLILSKTIGPSMKYGYAPRGFLIDYYDEALLNTFTKKIKEYFFKKGYAFIKINPEITYSKLDYDEKSKIVNSKNEKLVEHLKVLGYDKLKDHLYFESMLPKYTPIIYLNKYNFDKLDQSVKKNVEEAEYSGFRLIKGNQDDIEKFYSFIDKKTDKTIDYYKYFYEVFSKSDMVDLLLIELNFDTYVKYLQKQNIYESEKNEKINEEFNENPNSTDIYNRKMKSDQKMARISSEIAKANNKMQEHSIKEILGSAFIIKHQGRITLIISGVDKEYEGIDLQEFMYYKIIEEYKKAGYLFFDMNGITADYSDTNPYKELNNSKLKFKPDVFEYIGELDLIVNKPFHQILWSTNKIQKEFYKPAIKKENF